MPTFVVTSSSNRNRPSPQTLRLVYDDHGETPVWHGLRIVARSQRTPPFTPDCVVVEEDTCRVLGAGSSAAEESASLESLTRQMVEHKPARPGTVITRPGRPARLMAVVHDLDEDPTWRETWIRDALGSAVAAAAALGAHNIALPLLGTVHGRFPPERAVAVTLQTLAGTPTGPLRRVWLQVAERHRDRAMRSLAALVECGTTTSADGPPL